ncbi:MAG: glycosyltransferase family 2 protein [Bacteroidales bacterium]|nr:glycosyltransferase family 2 protein [Bacteroidales bacterium]MCF8327357.1 glycosyltransferase family 2 protein [Bacteroidales bacterium]
MIDQQKVVVVLPAYNAEKTLKKTVEEIPVPPVDEILLVDDASDDNTIKKAKELGLKHIISHKKNKGYGANQKSCYQKALDMDADIIIMLHPDYQYTPRLISPMSHIISAGIYPVVMGSRILGKGAIRGGMPVYKYYANRLLTFFQNLIMNQKLSEYHSGYRAFHRNVLENINLQANSDDFVFDNQMLAQILIRDYEIAEITCPTRYDKTSSSISFLRSLRYGVGVIKTSFQYRLHKWGLASFKIFKANG